MPAENLAAILEELTEIEDMGIDFDDREGDHARRFERPQELLREALALKVGVEEAVVELIDLRQAEQGTGHQRRPFLAKLLAHQSEPRALDEVGAALKRLNPDEVAAVLDALPEGEVALGALGRWYLSLARFAKSTGQDATEELRLAVLEAYAARKPVGGDASLTAAAKDDPSERVRTRARQILR